MIITSELFPRWEMYLAEAKRALRDAIESAKKSDYRSVTGYLSGAKLLRDPLTIALLDEEAVLLYKDLLRESLNHAVFLTLSRDADGQFSGGGAHIDDRSCYGNWIAVDLLEATVVVPDGQTPPEGFEQVEGTTDNCVYASATTGGIYGDGINAQVNNLNDALYVLSDRDVW